MHKHDFKLILDKAIGTFEKQEGQAGSAIRILTTISRCKCGEILIRPHPSYGLQPVFGERRLDD